jgi:hypothetical protein
MESDQKFKAGRLVIFFVGVIFMLVVNYRSGVNYEEQANAVAKILLIDSSELSIGTLLFNDNTSTINLALKNETPNGTADSTIKTIEENACNALLSIELNEPLNIGVRSSEPGKYLYYKSLYSRDCM